MGGKNLNTGKEFERFISENIDRIYRFAYSYTKKREDAEDVVSESVEKALKSLKKLKQPEFMKTWFYKIVSNTALTHINKKSNIELLSFNEIPESSENDDYSKLNFEELIKVLDVKYKSVIILRFMEDMKISEIAKILDVSENTVKTRLYTALRLLKSDMEEKAYE